eukprot:scaffold28934_cov31-Tisochrysis_lutea.AAC.1
MGMLRKGWSMRRGLRPNASNNEILLGDTVVDKRRRGKLSTKLGWQWEHHGTARLGARQQLLQTLGC